MTTSVPRLRFLALAVVPAALIAATLPAAAAQSKTQAQPKTQAGAGCRPGAATLAAPGARMYPDTGNGGYTSVHTDVDLVYDAATDRFLPGNHVVLHDRATQCLSSFSLDFERHSKNTRKGPDLRVSQVLVDGRPAAWRFAQPAYPGDPKGLDDPDPRAHEVSQTDPVGGPHHNPLPPACSPELLSQEQRREFSQDGWPCPANKLVITPKSPIARNAAFTVTVRYTGRPGVHNDGDGTEEGWFWAHGGASLVSTEPVGSEDWMPLNDYPTAKPTYDFNDTVEAGKTAVANGILTSVTRHRPSAEFPSGSVTWHWHSPEPVASYLVQSSIGNYALTMRTIGGVRYYEAQSTSISPARRRHNAKIMAEQQNITQWESQFNGPYPFSSDGIVIGTPNVDGGQEEMQTMISMDNGTIDPVTLYHENNHQWWGDNVTEHSYSMTFFKEGFGQLAQWLVHARNAERKHGGPGTRSGQAAFNRMLTHFFDATYRFRDGFWAQVPSDPMPWTLFDNAPTYVRPAASYVALRQILGPVNWDHALAQIQRTYGGATITEPQEEAVFRAWLPVRTPACQQRLTSFFAQWWDTSYHGDQRPQITGPGLGGPGFYHRGRSCAD